MDLYTAHDELGAFDSVLAAMALNHGAQSLISADRGFDSVPGLTWIDLASLHLEEILLTE